MPWKKNSAEMVAWMDEAMSLVPCSRKQMFGGVAYFVNDNMFAGLHQDMPFLRLSESDRQQILAEWDEASLFEPMEGRPMREYVVLPEALHGDPPALGRWIERSFGYASSLPAGGKKGERKARQ
jgi:TfoX/Sxy family transcriptional regulator of competence genes